MGAGDVDHLMNGGCLYCNGPLEFYGEGLFPDMEDKQGFFTCPKCRQLFYLEGDEWVDYFKRHVPDMTGFQLPHSENPDEVIGWDKAQ